MCLLVIVDDSAVFATSEPICSSHQGDYRRLYGALVAFAVVCCFRSMAVGLVVTCMMDEEEGVIADGFVPCQLADAIFVVVVEARFEEVLLHTDSSLTVLQHA